MKLLSALALSICVVQTAVAKQQGTLFFNSPADHQVLGLSENGQWAVGTKYDWDTDTSYSFRWNLESGRIEMIGGASATQIANDGTVVGSMYSNHAEVAATYQNGKWTPLEQPRNSSSCWGYSISPDGRYVTGTAVINSNSGENYISFIWTDGKISNELEAIGSSITYAISPDGKRAGGWASPDGTRFCGYWEASDNKFHYLEPGFQGQPWQAGKKFSSDGNKLLYWGGYHEDPRHPELGFGIKSIYDFATNDTTYIYTIEDDPFNFDLYDMSGDGKLVLGMEQNDEGLEYAIIWQAETGKTLLAEEYLETLGVTFDDEMMYPLPDGTHYIARAMATSGDGKTIALLYYDNYFDYHTLIVALDRNVSLTPAVNVEAHQVTGLPVVQLTWDEPLGDKSTLLGYEIYRDNQLLATLSTPLDRLCYYDKELAAGQYTYEVVALYAEGSSPRSNATTATVGIRPLETVQNLDARQKGVSSVQLIWDAPASNLTPCTYVFNTSDVGAFGGGTISFESGTCFSAEQMALYAGHRLTAVTFYPMTEQGSWLVNVYVHNAEGELESLGSFKVDQSTLTFGQANTYYLPRQITLQEGNDLVIGIQTNISDPSYNVQGLFEEGYQKGYSDLVRQVGEEDFYSIYEVSGGAYKIAWGVTALLAPEGQTADVDQIASYKLSLDDQEWAEAPSTSYCAPLEAGKHTLGVQPVYADGNVAQQVTTTLTIKQDLANLKAIEPEVKVEYSTATVSWNEPLDDDPTPLGYCNDDISDLNPSTNEDVSEVLALSEFPADQLRPYQGYQIDGVSFYPAGQASFVVVLYRGEEEVAYVELDDVVYNKWNYVSLPHSVLVDGNETYRLVIDCYDAPADVTPLGTDTSIANASGNLYQTPDDEGWYSLSDIGVTGNWMMRMHLTDPAAAPLEVDSYHVFLDGESVSDQTTTSIYFALADQDTHKVRVDATYAVDPQNDVRGIEVSFGATSAISEVQVMATPVCYIAADGRRHKSPVSGFNVICHSDGNVSKILAK